MKLEPFKDTDFIAFVSLLNDLATEFGGQATDEAAQLEYESFIGRDLSKQRVVVRHPEDAAQLIAYADYFVTEDGADANLSMGLLKNWWGQTLENELFNWLVSQVKPKGVKTLNMYAPGQAKRLRGFLEAQGFEAAGAYRMLVLESFTKPPNFTLPDSYTLTNYQETPDDALFIKASQLSFSDLWGHSAATKDAWEMLLEFYEPNNLYLLLHKGAPAGIFKVRVIENEGFVDSPGLAPEHRSAELYRALTLAGLDYIAPHKVERVWLETWGEPEEVIEIYEAIGFKEDVVELGFRRSFPISKP